jgi:hypothetical protein
MSPLAPANSGYPDGQRVENWDTQILYHDGGLNVNTSIQTGLLNVSRYAYLGGFDQAATLSLQATFLWYSDNVNFIPVGSRTFVLDSNINSRAQYRLPNLGPWATIVWTNITNGTPTHSSQIFATNREHPLEFIPAHVDLVNIQGSAIAGTTTQTVYSSDYYAGPVDVWFEAPAASWLLSFFYLDIHDNWVEFFQTPQSTAASDLQYKVVTPPGAWRVKVSNLNAAGGTYYLNVRQSQTGSAS